MECAQTVLQESSPGQGWLVKIVNRLLSKEGQLCQDLPDEPAVHQMRLGTRGELLWVEGSTLTLGPCFPEEPIDVGESWTALEQSFLLEKFEVPTWQDARVGVTAVIAHYLSQNRRQEQDGEGHTLTVHTEATTAFSVNEGRQLRSQTVQTSEWPSLKRSLESVVKLHLVSVT
jgi:hypothetical protein